MRNPCLSIATVSIASVVVSGALFLGGCNKGNEASTPATPTNTNSGTSADTAKAKDLLQKLKDDVATKNWSGAKDDVNQLAPLKGQLSSDEQSEFSALQKTVDASSLSLPTTLPSLH